MQLRLKRNPNRRRHAAARTYGWATFLGWFRSDTGPDAADYQPPVPPPSHCQKLPPLPPGSMPQRPFAPYPVLPPVTHTYQGGLAATVDLSAVSGRVMASLRPAFRLDANAPLFRDDTTWKQFEDSRLERLRRIQHIAEGWPDEHGVNLGTGQSPRTLVFSTSLYERFGNTGVQSVVSR